MNDRLYLQNFIDLLSEKHGMDKKDAEKFIKEFFLLIEEALEKDRSVKIKGLGTFKLVEVESRESVKVNTGERFQIPGYTKVSFVPDTSLRDIINKPFAHFETVVLNENTILEDTPIAESEEDGEDIVEEVVLQQLVEEEIAQEAVEVAPVAEDIAPEVEEVAPVTEEIAPEVEEVAPVAEEIAPEVEEVAPVEEVIWQEVPVLSKEAEIKVTEETSSSSSASEEVADITAASQSEVKPKLTAEEIIARELAASAPVAAPHEEQIKKKPTGKPKQEKVEKSPLPYLIAVIIFVLLLCGGALLFIYYPDLFDSHPKIEKAEKPVDTVDPVPAIPVVPRDTTVIEKDTVSEVVPPAKEVAPVAVPAAKKESKSTAKPAPFKPDSVNYKITGTKTLYTIKEGETLTRVALRFYGTKALWPYIVKHNPDVIKNPDHVPYGTTIKIPELVKK